MASFGKVLDLLDDRYLDLQDVHGNVESLPTLVPYEEYAQHMLVYRMDINHEIFMGMIQDFTMRRSIETQKELWTWLVQWELGDSQPTQQPSSPKKARLDAPQTNALPNAALTPRQVPALTVCERRSFDGALMLEEDMLRILIDIVQVSSSLVPNFIEFLYRWVDFYEGDGRALKAALQCEIPSLWDFEFHPLLLPREEDAGPDKQDEDDTAGQSNAGASNGNVAELRQSSPTRTMRARPKPDTAAIELRTFHSEESERLKYREVKFGIQPAKIEQPLPPLINIPRDHHKRIKYYAACFKSRQRALWLLLEAGMTVRQIKNYQKLQTAHPRETPEEGDGGGLRNYQKDAKFAEEHFAYRERLTKQHEIAISNRLEAEAEIAASHAVADGANGLPLIPPTPTYPRKLDLTTTILRRLKEMKEKNKDNFKIDIVPGPLVGKLKSKVYENARGTVGRIHKDSGSGSGSNGDSGADDDDSAAALPSLSPTAASNAPLTPINLNSLLQQPAPPLDQVQIGTNVQTMDAGQDLANRVQEHLQAILQRSTSSTVASAGPSSSSQPGNMSNSNVPPNLSTIRPTLPQPSVSQGTANAAETGTDSTVGAYQTAGTSTPSLPVLPRLSSLPQRPHPSLSPSGVQSGQDHSPNPAQGTSTEGSRSIPAYGPPPNASGSSTANAPPASFVPGGLDLDHFMRLYREQQRVPPGLQLPPQDPRIPPPGFAATGAQVRPADTEVDQSSAQLPLPPQPGRSGNSIAAQWLAVNSSNSSDPPRQLPRLVLPGSHQRLAAQLPLLDPGSSTTATDDAHASDSSTPTLQPPPLNAMLPSSRPGIARNAPSPIPIPIVPHSPTSAFTTFGSQVLATSPFFPATSNKLPVLIYIPKIVVSGNGLGPGGAELGTAGCMATDAMMLGYENAKTRALVLDKAILLPMGVWDNLLRKVRDHRWTVLETYVCPKLHPLGEKEKGKGKAVESGGVMGCHRAAYQKLVYAYGMIDASPIAREEKLTKRWKINRGAMTNYDRGSVWEGWGVYVDRGLEMSAAERKDALLGVEEEKARRARAGNSGEELDPNSDEYEVERRRKEIEELIEEEEAMED